MTVQTDTAQLLDRLHAAQQAGNVDAMVELFTESGLNNHEPRTPQNLRHHFERRVEDRFFESRSVDYAESRTIEVDGNTVTFGPVVYVGDEVTAVIFTLTRTEQHGSYQWLIRDTEEVIPPAQKRQLMAWCAQVNGEQWQYVSDRPLIGGISGDVRQVSLEAGSSSRTLVLRSFDTGQQWTEGAIADEREVLAFLAGNQLDFKTPTLIDSDSVGGDSGRPAILTSWIEGQVIVDPVDRSPWIRGMATALAQIHKVTPTDALRRDQPGPGPNPRDETVPTWSQADAAWEAVIDARRQGVPESATVFRHGDYHPTNILWHEQKLSGVIDWGSAGVGPCGLDLAHCRINLVTMHGLETADQFLHAYQEIGHPDSRDDHLQAICDAVACWIFAFLYRPWFQLGFPVYEEEIHQRLNEYAESIAARLETGGG